mmetsp:Transcript_23191/g.38146  ORF Transcript_23191/g.38146 Transcript_23191/m.38146 type:complete len:321 (+) Transcript_23191:31-993(+)|eukprot:CAMPEP_0184348938 /NCGR_PEP_ID=MMETSP1089-20130417/32053_1 /TAXON_ID=38269 ORGANISM="Gloeochaete wittrockiana, Strain SAG46.84" /NCGR_SAMPLE_ID=MMETSP1089 /ASSEMBLY_ACC=CAM_ASM_000445 /LENGTH=320 /DNA_ID=CAMNT_0026680939 /DNA_START=23 /DNA_END=985 /DNA_ORIENTATION=+
MADVATSPVVKLREVIAKCQPYLMLAQHYIVLAQPYIDQAIFQANKTWDALQPYHPEEFLPALCGLTLVFFGGHFLTLIAAVEAFRLTGWDRSKKCLGDLWESYKVAMAAYKKDDEKDDDNDGAPDVKQISSDDLLRRKLLVLLKAVDPDKVTEAMAGIYAGLIAVICTLRIRFAQAVTLGASIGDIFSRVADTFARPILLEVVPPEYQKWIGPGIKYTCKWLGVSVAWWCLRVIQSFYSATRGAQIFGYGLLHWSARNGYTAPFDEGSPLFAACTTVIGLFGFYWQFSHGFSLPFPLNVLLFPITLLEWILMYLVGVKG